MELAELVKGRFDIGGLASFIGLVRSESEEGPITELRLEHYPGMTERKLEEAEQEALRRWPLSASLIIHRYGTLNPGERIVLVATASSHRKEAMEACNFLIDWLKVEAPFWKWEDKNGWVEAKDQDTIAAMKWKK